MAKEWKTGWCFLSFVFNWNQSWAMGNNWETPSPPQKWDPGAIGPNGSLNWRANELQGSGETAIWCYKILQENSEEYIFTRQQGTLASIRHWFGKQSFKSPTCYFRIMPSWCLLSLRCLLFFKKTERYRCNFHPCVSNEKNKNKTVNSNNIIDNNPANPQGKKKKKAVKKQQQQQA